MCTSCWSLWLILGDEVGSDIDVVVDAVENEPFFSLSSKTLVVDVWLNKSVEFSVEKCDDELVDGDIDVLVETTICKR